MRKKFVNAAIWFAIFLCGGILAPAMVYPTLAQEIEVGTGLICDEAAQLEKFVSLVGLAKSNAEALQEVNGDTNACGVIVVAYVRGPKVSQIRNSQGAFDVVEIAVISVNLGRGFQHVSPFKQFTLFKVKEEGV